MFPHLLVSLSLSLTLGLGSRPAAPVPAAGRQPAVDVPILMYHHIGITRAPMPAAQFWVSAAAFADQMAELVQRGYHAVSLDQVAAALRGGPALPARAVVITFDDGAADNFAAAFPVLRRDGLTATFLVVTGWVGTPGYLTWDQVAQLAAAGMTIGAHTRTHPYLDRLAPAAAQAEIAGARADLQAHLPGRPITVFAYPYGHTTPALERQAAQAGYTAALGTGPAAVRHTAAELYDLRRIGVYRWTTPAAFQAALP